MNYEALQASIEKLVVSRVSTISSNFTVDCVRLSIISSSFFCLLCQIIMLVVSKSIISISFNVTFSRSFQLLKTIYIFTNKLFQII